jgi:hypothetical protein
MTRTTTITTVAALTLALAASVAAQDLTVFVVADDGTPLATDVYLPFGFGPWPVLLTRSPYGRAGQAEIGEVMSLLGVAYVAQDTRGRFDSGGSDTVFRDDGDDGRATLRWIVDQFWSDGRVMTWGPSALGITQYLMAPDAGPSLVCQVPMVASADLYNGAFFQGGAFRESLVTNWLAGQGSLPVLDEMLSHRTRDQWWAPLVSLSRASEITAAALHVAGWYDIFQQGTLDAFIRLQTSGGVGARGKQHLLIGPWTHSGTGGARAGELQYPLNAALDPTDMILPWIDFCLLGGSSEVESWPTARIYLMGAVDEPDAVGNRWLDIASWPPESRVESLYLAAGGRLEDLPPTNGEIAVLESDPGRPVPTLGGANLFADLVVDDRPMGDGPHDQRSIEEREDVLVFTSRVLTEPLTVVGHLEAMLWIVADTPDLDLAVRLTDVYPDGRSMLVTDGIRRARSRCGDDRECFLTPGEPTELTVDLWSTALVFAAGHRVRISVSGSNWPRFEVNPNHGGPFESDLAPVVAHTVLLSGPSWPTRLELPVLDPPRRSSRRVTP